MTKTGVAENTLSQHTVSGRVQKVTLAARHQAAAPEIEAERERAVSDFLRDHTLTLIAAPQATGLDMTVTQDGGYFVFSFSATTTEVSARLSVALFRPFFRDYALICDNFYKTARSGDIHRLEAIDAGRKGLHDEAAETLRKAAETVFSTDLPTARRLFTLIYVLHMRSLNESTLT
jgi:uncharacterized protein (UPF0262 family)